MKRGTAAFTELPMVNSAVGLRAAGAADRNQRTVPFFQKRPGGARQPHMGEEFQRIAVFPIGVGKVEEIAALGGAGIVDQNIEPAELAPGLVDQLFRRGLLAQIQHRDARSASGFADRLGDFIKRRRVAAGQHHVAAFGRERQRDAAADAAARSGHQRDLTLQSQFHFLLAFIIRSSIRAS